MTGHLTFVKTTLKERYHERQAVQFGRLALRTFASNYFQVPPACQILFSRSPFETASTTGINNSRVTWIVSSSEELALRPLFRKNAFHCVPQDWSERPIYCDHSVTSANVRLKRRQYAAELLVVSANLYADGRGQRIRVREDGAKHRRYKRCTKGLLT